jgi:hypothetical protein
MCFHTIKAGTVLIVDGRKGSEEEKAMRKRVMWDEGIVSTHWAKARFTLLSNKNKPLS